MKKPDDGTQHRVARTTALTRAISHQNAPVESHPYRNSSRRDGGQVNRILFPFSLPSKISLSQGHRANISPGICCVVWWRALAHERGLDRKVIFIKALYLTQGQTPKRHQPYNLMG
jgi:hypothetical protein